MVSTNLFLYFAPMLLNTLQTDVEPVNFGYSTKNMPNAQPQEYLKCLIDKTESFLRWIRWKQFHFLNPSNQPNKETFGFKTTKSPPPVREINEFEDKMLKLIQNIKFKDAIITFQRKLS